jgi:hypothetical protein
MRLGKACLMLALVCGVVAMPRAAEAALTLAEMKCSAAIGKGGLGRVRGLLKLEQRCRNANLVAPGSCAGIDPAAVAKLDGQLATVVKACTLPPDAGTLANLGFPGPCTDTTAGNGFTPGDLAACIATSHADIVGAMLALQYDTALSGPLAKPELACQREMAKQSAGLVACVLKAVQKCRAGIMRGKLPGIPPHTCATDEPKTAAAIAKCRAKLSAAVTKRCTDPQIATLAACEPNQASVSAAASCLVDAHLLLTDGPAIDVPPDLVDYQYAERGGICGDGVVNNVAEECDGSDDAACPGACGAPAEPHGYFACLCTTTPRIRIVEHADADTDNGWTGLSADAGVAEGGGYLADLYDCDGSGLCNLGPSCSLAPHSPCHVLHDAPSGTTGNSICAGLGQGVCRKGPTATGPHCAQDPQKKCDMNDPNDPVCDAPGDACVVTLGSPPEGAYSGGVTVCNVLTLSEDVVGTVNVLTGESVVRAPQVSRTYNRSVGSANKPCPVCGGFCAVDKERCASDEECAFNAGPCVTASVCSDGPREGRLCRTTPPFGNASGPFGATSVDCPPSSGGEITSPAGLALYVTERTTGTATMAPTQQCASAGFMGNACRGGSSEGRPCATASECPGGTCDPQCFCPGQQRPNACFAACVGGTSDAADCVTDSDCPGGFCHAADCRLDPTDPDSAQEGICTAGPPDSHCSITTYRPCAGDASCNPPQCPYCETGETCVTRNRACFVNSGIFREGTPRTPEGTSVGVYCIAGDNAAVNSVAGFPGPAAFTQPETQLTEP